MTAVVPDRESYLARWSALHGGYDPHRSVLVGGWLRVVYALSAPLARRGLSPDAISYLTVLVGAAGITGLAAAGGGWLAAAAGLVLLSGLADSLDGAVAVLTDRSSRWGFVLDSLADRCVDASYLVALWLAGAPAGLCVAAGGLTGLLEYARARAGAAGMTEIGVVSVAERPTRVLVTAGFLLAAAVMPGPSGWAAAGAGVWIGLHVVGLVQLLVVLRRRLR